jgi:hypothetical protein
MMLTDRVLISSRSTYFLVVVCHLLLLFLELWLLVPLSGKKTLTFTFSRPF